MTVPNPTDATPSSATAASSTPPTTPDWRVPESHPNPLFRGKTAAEVLSLGDQLAGAYVQQQQVISNFQAPPPVQQPATWDPASLRDDDYVDGKTLKSYLQNVAQPVRQGFDSVYGNLAQFAMSQVRQKYPDAFERYGAEIEALTRNIPLEGRNLDNLSAAVELVLGRHWKDEKARLEAQYQQDPTLRGGTSAGPGPGRPAAGSWRDELPNAYREILDKKGISDETIREFFVANNLSPEQQKEWWERAKKHNPAVITERSIRG